MSLHEAVVGEVHPEEFAAIAGPEREAQFVAAAERACRLLEGRRVWSINSTASGGGVAELLHVLLAYAKGAGVDARWLVIEASPEFFEVTKRLHNRLHGSSGDAGLLGEAERQTYEAVMAANAGPLFDTIGTDDVVILHDPQTLGLAPALRAAGTPVVWRCHVGSDDRDARTREAWDFLGPWLAAPDAYVFSRQSYVPDILAGANVHVIAPAIDPLSPKNRELGPDEQRAILRDIGGLPPDDADVVVQVSRWDRLKDMAGVMRGFVDEVADAHDDAHLVLAGPATSGVADDPEGAVVLQECRSTWEGLPPNMRRRVHLIELAMEDAKRNALMVNALQRRADVVVQKSLAEGFGLTVAEAMWKGRAVVASAVGGIQDQIVDGQSGRLIQRPDDLAEFGAAVSGLLADRTEAKRLGDNARERVREHFLAWRNLEDWLAVLESLL